MNNVFCFSRFSKLLSQEISLSRKKLAVWIAIIMGTAIVIAYINRGVLIGSFLILIWTWLLIFLPFRLYPFLFDKIKGTQWSMLPASKLEKFASLFVQLVIIYPILLLGFVYLGHALAVWIQRSFLYNEGSFLLEGLSGPDDFYRLFLSIWSIQSVAIFCVIHFKPNKIQKSVIWTLIVILALSLMGTGLVYLGKNSPSIQELLQTVLCFLERHMQYLLLIWTIFFWGLSYLRLSKHQF